MDQCGSMRIEKTEYPKSLVDTTQNNRALQTQRHALMEFKRATPRHGHGLWVKSVVNLGESPSCLPHSRLTKEWISNKEEGRMWGGPKKKDREGRTQKKSEKQTKRKKTAKKEGKEKEKRWKKKIGNHPTEEKPLEGLKIFDHICQKVAGNEDGFRGTWYTRISSPRQEVLLSIGRWCYEWRQTHNGIALSSKRTPSSISTS